MSMSWNDVRERAISRNDATNVQRTPVRRNPRAYFDPSAAPKIKRAKKKDARLPNAEIWKPK